MKLPRGGAALLRQREQSMHPPMVVVIHGTDHQRRPRGVPCLCVAPDERPDRLDWSMLAALPVQLVVRNGFDDSVTRLAAMLADVAAPVTVRWTDDKDRHWHVDAAELFFSARNKGQWPVGWSTAQHADYEARKWRYFRAIYTDVMGE